jgi:arginine deiminase
VERRTGGAGVESEVGVLRRVLVHRPGRELERLTPTNRRELLFDDVPWPQRAREEHDAFVVSLRARHVEVLYLRDLLADVLALDQPRSELIAAAVDPARLEHRLVALTTNWLHGLAPEELADVLIGGLTVGELCDGGRSLLESTAGGAAFVVTPLPNHMFTRDSSAWIGRRAYVGAMALNARRRETTHLAAVYRHHPLFQAQGVPVVGSAALEGGDVLVLGPHRVLIGIGPRTGPAAVERLAFDLTDRDPAAELLVAVLPSRRATIHLDTVLTMLDRDAFTVYPEVTRAMKVFRLRRGRDGLRIEAEVDLVSALARSVSTGALRLVETGGDEHGRDREQWDDANNLLALAPGVLIGYDRASATNERLDAAGFDVITIPGSELCRGRGGARCLSCPIERAPLDSGV